MYQIELFYGYEEGDSGIFHSFEARDPKEIAGDEIGNHLAEILGIDPDSDSFHWDSMYIHLPNSVVQSSKADAIQEYLAHQKKERSKNGQY